MKTSLLIKAPNQMVIVRQESCTRLMRDEILVKIRAAGICGSDLHIYNGTHPIGSYPMVMGHEAAGEVVAIGPDVNGLKVGDHVVIDPIVNCNKCYSCVKLDRPNICENLKVRGVHVNGAYTTEMIISERGLCKISSDIDWDVAALVEPLSVGFQIVTRGRISSSDTVLVNGVGTIGAVTILFAKYAGAKVIASDICDSHLEIARVLGADFIANPKKENLPGKVREATGGEGASLLVDSVGFAAIADSLKPCAAFGARFVIIGFDKTRFHFDPFDITFHEWEIIGSRLNTHCFTKVIQMLENKEIEPSRIITNKVDYTEAPSIFPAILSNPNDYLKVILKF